MYLKECKWYEKINCSIYYPIRLWYKQNRNKTGITEKSDDSVTLGEVGWELDMYELRAAFEAAFDKDLDISLDSSVMSIYSETLDD